MKKTSEFSFREVILPGINRVAAPVAASVRKSDPGSLVIRLSAELVKSCGFKKDDLLTPYVDVENRAVLLISGVRTSTNAKRLFLKSASSKSPEVQFPRVGVFRDLFDVAPMRAMDLREASNGRLMFVIPPAPRED